MMNNRINSSKLSKESLFNYIILDEVIIYVIITTWRKEKMMEISERLKELLDINGLTQKELANRAGVSESAMSHYVKGDRIPRPTVLARIAGALNTSTDDLLGINNTTQEDVEQAISIIGRNASELSKEQKMRIINIIMEGNN